VLRRFELEKRTKFGGRRGRASEIPSTILFEALAAAVSAVIVEGSAVLASFFVGRPSGLAAIRRERSGTRWHEDGDLCSAQRAGDIPAVRNRVRIATSCSSVNQLSGESWSLHPNTTRASGSPGLPPSQRVLALSARLRSANMPPVELWSHERGPQRPIHLGFDHLLLYIENVLLQAMAVVLQQFDPTADVIWGPAPSPNWFVFSAAGG
jgi:hypothetical protein